MRTCSTQSVASNLPMDKLIEMEDIFECLKIIQLNVADLLYHVRETYSHDADQRLKLPTFQISQKVLVYSSQESIIPSKMDPTWTGPAIVIASQGLKYSIQYENGRVLN